MNKNVPLEFRHEKFNEIEKRVYRICKIKGQKSEGS